MPHALVALGSNLGDRRQILTRALELLAGSRQTSLVAVSTYLETLPIGGPPQQGPFLNAVAVCETALAADGLHDRLHEIERVLGRQRGERWAARAIDLDLLLYDDAIVSTPSLELPHPRMAFRRFVLEGAAEVAPEMIHPTIGWSMRELLAHLNAAIPYVALLGPPGIGKSRLADAAAKSLGGRLLVDPPPAPASVSDPSSQPSARAIQFLDQRARLLDGRRWPQRDTLTISDFYFDQSLAYACVELDAAGVVSVESRWQVLNANVMPPKLLVVLAGLSKDAGKLQGEMLKLAARRNLGPVLYLQSSNEQERLDEVAAAIQAMK